MQGQGGLKAFVYFLRLALFFLISFGVSLSITFYLVRLFAYQPVEDSIEVKNLFDSAFVVSSPETYYVVRDADALEPTLSRDFLLLAWFRLRHLPREGERYVLLTKYDADSPSLRGYALGLAREGRALRPVVWWRTENGNGRWFAFEDVGIAPQQWFMLALSFHDGQFLGLHVGFPSRENGDKLVLAGGYRLEFEEAPHSSADLLVGSFKTPEVRGGVGSVGIAHVPRLERRLGEILQQAVHSADEIPKSLQDHLVLWTVDGETDRSSAQQTVVARGRENTRRDGRSAQERSAQGRSTQGRRGQKDGE